MIQVCYNYCTLYFCYYIRSTSDHQALGQGTPLVVGNGTKVCNIESHCSPHPPLLQQSLIWETPGPSLGPTPWSAV